MKLMSEAMTKTLSVELTIHEKVERAEEWARLQAEREEIEDERKLVMRKLKKRLIGIDDRIAELAGIIRTGHEERDVEVKLQNDFAAGEVRTIRIDTGEVVSARPMELHERQAELDVA